MKKFQKYVRAKKNARERYFYRTFTPCAREREREGERASHASKNKAAFSALCSDALFFERERERERDILARDLSLSYISFFDRTCEKKV